MSLKSLEFVKQCASSPARFDELFNHKGTVNSYIDAEYKLPLKVEGCNSASSRIRNQYDLAKIDNSD